MNKDYIEIVRENARIDNSKTVNEIYEEIYMCTKNQLDLECNEMKNRFEKSHF